MNSEIMLFRFALISVSMVSTTSCLSVLWMLPGSGHFRGVHLCNGIKHDGHWQTSPIGWRKFKGQHEYGATRLRASEREICLWEGLWEDLWKSLKNLWKPLRKPLKTSQKKKLWKSPSQRPSHHLRPSQRQISLSEALGPVAPIALPLELSPNWQEFKATVPAAGCWCQQRRWASLTAKWSKRPKAGEAKLSTSTVAALFSKMALTA